jgi:hypothetical protein
MIRRGRKISHSKKGNVVCSSYFIIANLGSLAESSPQSCAVYIPTGIPLVALSQKYLKRKKKKKRKKLEMDREERRK